MHRIKQAIARRKTPSHPQHLETETQTTSMQRNIRNQKLVHLETDTQMTYMQRNIRI